MNDTYPRKGVYRVPSLSYVFKTVKSRQKFVADMTRLTYLVDPENTLKDTQIRF